MLHEQHYFELAGELPVVTEFIVSESDAERIVALVRKENIDLVYVCWPAEYSATSAPSAPSPTGRTGRHPGRIPGRHGVVAAAGGYGGCGTGRAQAQLGSWPGFHLMLQPTLGICSLIERPASAASAAARRSAPLTGCRLPGRLASNCPR